MAMLQEQRKDRVVVPCSTGSETQHHTSYFTEILTDIGIPFSNIVRKYILSGLMKVTKKIN